MTAAVGARNLFKVDAGVVHALLQARYYDGSKGECLSEDPVFLGNPNDQDLTNPQSLNSYSYANDNPINKSDPSGKDAVLAAPLLGAIAVVLVYASFLPQNQQRQIVAALAQIVHSVASSFAGSSMSDGSKTSITINSNQSLVSNLTVNTGSPAGTKSDGSVPWSNINLSQSGKSQSTPKPNDAPSGTKPIDQTGLSKDQVHQIKQIIEAGPKDWVGKAPNGDIITGTPDGKTINHGPIQPYGH
jgi:RHS repeat-associated protein